MEACEIEDLLSSFSSETFAIQSQSEKDLRASLETFFTLNSNQNENKKHGPIFEAESDHLTPPTHPSSTNPETSMESGLNEISNQEFPQPNTPMGTPAQTNGFKMSTSPPLSNRHGHHYNSPTLSHQTIGGLVNVTQNPNTLKVNCLACLYKLQNPSQFSTVCSNQHQEGCDYLQSLPHHQHTICKPKHHLNLDSSLDQQFNSIEMEL
ncbi:hypothetical protein CROQUDRAFT_110946 [Cronartium quercuum f. sp. fusiforme G11]|uniref:Uncharacterized protein n=1 Tax=Cronartium quercuum f. sp. fusiforme G11 TaxID=708437 RepID=A0A9P6NAM9_9BASI|nr:hypothetical protein CROQUDRAFT_110946 [Cronartium quercuum f. sp. fusiforme G11]